MLAFPSQKKGVVPSDDNASNSGITGCGSGIAMKLMILIMLGMSNIVWLCDCDQEPYVEELGWFGHWHTSWSCALID